MADPVLHLIAGPNGAGKSTLFEHVIGPVTNLEFVNADLIAAQRWPDDPARAAYDASEAAAARRAELMDARRSFVTETVFSHRSKVDLVTDAVAAGYLVTLHAVIVPEKLAVARVRNRVDNGGHSVPVAKVRARFRRLWPLVVEAISMVERAAVYDNTSAADPFRVLATFQHGKPLHEPAWPAWTPKPLTTRWSGTPR